GSDKKKMLEKFPVTRFISDQEICQYKVDVENWVQDFCCPSQGYINLSQNFGLYQK
ncbi:27559_t:CDS:2, partial [Racocetra persica]